MRYHLKTDGTAGPCKATEGNCPFGDAIHGASVEEVYSKLEKVMKQQLLPASLLAPATPRESYAEVGRQGQMLHYTDPQLIKEQLEALQALGLTSGASEILSRYKPELAEKFNDALAKGQDFTETINFDAFEETPVSYEYGHKDTEYGSEWYTGEHYTWVGDSHYELQTLALYDLMDRLEGEESLDSRTIELYGKALGNTSVSDSRHLSFNYNPARQSHTFMNNVKNRFITEGFNEENISKNESKVSMPDFFWKGLTTTQKEKIAEWVITQKYSSNPRNQAQNFAKRVLAPASLPNRDFGGMISSVITPNKALDLPVTGENKTMLFDTAAYNSGGNVVAVTYKLENDGFKVQESKKLFYSREERKNGRRTRDHESLPNTWGYTDESRGW